MPKRCPPGVICIENCTLLFIVIAILLGYYAYQQNYASRAMQHGQYSNKEKHFIYTAMPGPISAPLVDQMPQHMFDNRDVLRDPYAPPLRDTRVFPKNSSDPRGVPGIPINVATQSFDTSSSQVPHSSSYANPFGVPAQSEQEELSPPQTPHSSITESPPQSPAQSSTQLGSGLVTQLLHWST